MFDDDPSLPPHLWFHQRILFYPESLLLPRRGSPSIMNFIESHFIEIAFIIVFISIINMTSTAKDNSATINESNVSQKIVCR